MKLYCHHIGLPGIPFNPINEKDEKQNSTIRNTILNKNDRVWAFMLNQIQCHFHACNKSSIAKRGTALRRTATASSHFKSQAKLKGVKPKQIWTPNNRT